MIAVPCLWESCSNHDGSFLRERECCGAEVGEGVTFLLRYARCRVCKRLACENCASNNPCFAGSLLSFVLGGRESKVFQNSPLKDSMGVRWLEEEFGHLKLDKLLFSYHGIMA